ncbi:MAG: hypothetical protein JO099_02010 [Acidobacteriia bacterium]|nr:hypothetical protein [Terriglobia bacterium]
MRADLLAEAAAGTVNGTGNLTVDLTQMGITLAKVSAQAPGGEFVDYAATAMTPGYFGLYTDAVGAGSRNDGGGAESQVIFTDTLTTNGYQFVLPVHLKGSVGISYTIPNTTFNEPPEALVHLQFACIAYVGIQDTCNIQDPDRTDYTQPTNIDETILFEANTQPGVPFFFEYYFREFSIASLGLNSADSWQAGVLGDFSHTGAVQPAEVLDANGNVIENPVITSASGYDYLHPVGPQTPVPEPRATGLVAGLLGALWVAARRRVHAMRYW